MFLDIFNISSQRPSLKIISIDVDQALSPWHRVGVQRFHHRFQTRIRKLPQILQRQHHQLIHLLIGSMRCGCKHEEFDRNVWPLFFQLNPLSNPSKIPLDKVERSMPIHWKSFIICGSLGLCGLLATPPKMLTRRRRTHASVLIAPPGQRLWFPIAYS